MTPLQHCCDPTTHTSNSKRGRRRRRKRKKTTLFKGPVTGEDNYKELKKMLWQRETDACLQARLITAGV